MELAHRHIRTLTKHLFDLLKKTFLVFIRLGLKVRRVSEFFQNCFFFCRNLLWRPNIYMDKLISFFVRIYGRKSFPFQTENLSTLRARRDSDLGLSIDGGNFYLGTENGVCKRNMQIKSHI